MTDPITTDEADAVMDVEFDSRVEPTTGRELVPSMLFPMTTGPFVGG